MTIPPEISNLIEQLTEELDRIERQANEGLVIVSQFLERFPNNARLVGLSATLGNVLFFVNNFRSRIENIVHKISAIDVSVETIQEAGKELSEVWGRVIECKMLVARTVAILENLQ